MLDELRWRNDDVPVMVMSAGVPAESMRNLLREGAQGFLTKPFYLEDMQKKCPQIFWKVDERDGSCSHFDSLKKDGQARYLIKEPGSGSQNGKHPGYNFYQEELREVQMLNVMVHRSAAENVLKKI